MTELKRCSCSNHCDCSCVYVGWLVCLCLRLPNSKGSLCSYNPDASDAGEQILLFEGKESRCNDESTVVLYEHVALVRNTVFVSGGVLET